MAAFRNYTRELDLPLEDAATIREALECCVKERDDLMAIITEAIDEKPISEAREMKYEIELRITAPDRASAIECVRKLLASLEDGREISGATGGGGPNATHFSVYAGNRRRSLEERVSDLERNRT